MNGLKDLAARIDAFSVRERALIMITVLAGIFVLWNTALMTPLDAKEKSMRQAIVDTQSELRQLSAEERVVVARGEVDPDAAAREHIEQLEDDLADIRERLNRTTENLIEPQKMPEVLARVLNTSDEIEVLSLVGLGAKSLTAKGEDPASVSSPLDTAFRHGFSLVVQASYLDTLALLRDLETLPWTFFWESVELNVEEYPETVTEIRVFTLSLSPDWIGV